MNSQHWKGLESRSRYRAGLALLRGTFANLLEAWKHSMSQYNERNMLRSHKLTLRKFGAVVGGKVSHYSMAFCTLHYPLDLPSLTRTRHCRLITFYN